MRICLVDAFPNRPHTAEAEFIRRFMIAAERLGWTAARAVTSTDVLDAAPDLVLATHEYTPKLTEVPTLGIMWGPPAFYRDDPVRVRNILSHDGHLAASSPIRDWLTGLLAEAGKAAPVLGALHPTCHATPFVPLADGDLRLFYAGVNWDGGRHGDMFVRLAESLPLALAGPVERWGGLERHAIGPVPFDGTAILGAIRRCGVALCLNRAEHVAAETPSARLFEAAAAGAVAIADDTGFNRRLFGDTVLYVDPALDPTAKADAIRAHWDWIGTHRAAARDMAAAAHSRFVAEHSLDTVLPRLLPEALGATRHAGRFDTVRAGEDTPVVEFIVRVGSRPVGMVERCLRSLAAQTWPSLALTIVDFAPVEGLDTLLASMAPRFAWINRVTVTDNRVRSNALWAGLRAASAPFVANMDDDDRVHPNHVATLMEVLRNRPDHGLAFSGTIRVEEEPGRWFDQENFSGPGGAVIEEPRQLKFLEPFGRTRLWCHENFIQSNAWIARRELLRDDVLVDPEMDVAEDLYLYLMLSRGTDFATSFRPTAEWNWRSTTGDNATRDHHRWIEARRRIGRMTAHLPDARATEAVRAAILEAEADRVRLRADVESLTTLLRESEADRAARLSSIQQLTRWLQESEADRAARLDVIHALQARVAALEAELAARRAPAPGDQSAEG